MSTRCTSTRSTSCFSETFANTETFKSSRQDIKNEGDGDAEPVHSVCSGTEATRCTSGFAEDGGDGDAETVHTVCSRTEVPNAAIETPVLMELSERFWDDEEAAQLLSSIWEPEQMPVLKPVTFDYKLRKVPSLARAKGYTNEKRNGCSDKERFTALSIARRVYCCKALPQVQCEAEELLPAAPAVTMPRQACAGPAGIAFRKARALEMGRQHPSGQTGADAGIIASAVVGTTVDCSIKEAGVRWAVMPPIKPRTAGGFRRLPAKRAAPAQ